MADIPRVTGPTVEPKGGTVFQNPGSTGGAFGEASIAGSLKTAEALQKAGANLARTALERAAADHRLDARNDLNLETGLLGALNRKWEEKLRTENNTTGFDTHTDSAGKIRSAEEVIAGFRNNIDQDANRAISDADPSFKTDEGAANFKRGVAALLEKYHGAAIDSGLKTSNARLENRWQDHMSGSQQKILSGAGILEDEETQAWMLADHLSPAEAPAVTEKRKRDASATLAGAEVARYIAKGLPLQAQRVLEEQMTAGRFVEADRLKWGIKITELKFKEQEKTDKARRIIGEMEKFGPVTPEMKQRIVAGVEGLTLPVSPQPVAAETTLQMYAKAHGIRREDVPLDVVDRALKLEQKDEDDIFVKSFGGGVQGRAAASLFRPDAAGLSDLDRFEMGLSEPQEDGQIMQRMVTAARIADNGQIFTSPRILQALRARKIDPATFFTPEAQFQGSFLPRPVATSPAPATAPAAQEPSGILFGKPAGATAPQAASQSAAAQDDNAQFADAAKQVYAQPTPETIADVVQQLIPEQISVALEGKTVAEWVFDPATGGLTGPIPALQRGFSRIPFIGGAQGQVSRIAVALPIITNRLVAGLQNSPRFAEGEREHLLASLEVDTSVIDTPGALLDRIASVYSVLKSFESEIINDTNNSKLSQKQRGEDRVSLALIQASLARMSPPMILEHDPKKLLDAAKKFEKANPPGTPYIYFWRGEYKLKKTTGGDDAGK